jgi:hypothetical protein
VRQRGQLLAHIQMTHHQYNGLVDRFIVPRADPDPESEQVLIDVDRQCGFTRHFRPRSGLDANPEHAVPLLAAIVAHGTNLGLAVMAQSTEGVTPDILQYVSHRHIREETLKAATAEIVDCHHRLPLASV